LIILGIIALILTLILVIGLHEMGHALTAKLFAVKIQRISIGFGKPLLCWRGKRRSYDWVWSLWPIGGYVQLLNSRIQPVVEKDLPFSFDKKPIWVRCIILLSGAFANLIVALLALTIMFMMGYEKQKAIIHQIFPQSVSAQAGLKAGDQFLEIANQKADSWQEVGMCLVMNLGKPNVEALIRNSQGNVHKIILDLSSGRYSWRDHSLLHALGMEPSEKNFNKQSVEGLSFSQAFIQAILKSLQLLSFFLIVLKQLLMGAIPFTMLLGPIGLFVISTQSFLQGLAVFLYFIASLSLAVGLVNLFPIPGLDGGSILYALIEKIRGKPVSVAMEVLLHRLTMIWLTLLLLQLIMNDLQRFLIRN
jgi:regulator of sigma E protease